MYLNRRVKHDYIAPEAVRPGIWSVECAQAAVEVLQRKEYVELFDGGAEFYAINFDYNSMALIRPADPLWKILDEIARDYLVEVYPINFSMKYIPWKVLDEVDHSPRDFDSIVIRRKP